MRRSPPLAGRRGLLTAVFVAAIAGGSVAAALAGGSGQGRLRVLPECGPSPAPTTVRGLPDVRSSRFRWFSEASPFNTPIPRDAAVDRRSRQMVAAFAAVVREHGFVLSQKRFTKPVYYANASTPRISVRLTAPWAHGQVLRGVPMPTAARPDPGEDGHLVVVDVPNRCEWDFWQARRVGRRWLASFGNRIRIDSDGIYPDGRAAIATGWALTAGTIFPGELARGRIDHALVFKCPCTSARGWVWPATAGDGDEGVSGAIPQGARLQLDPTLDLDTLDLEPYERTIARALQRYGMYLGDSSGAPSIDVVHPQSYERNPYEGLLPDETYVPIDGIPVERLHVLRLPPLRHG